MIASFRAMPAFPAARAHCVPAEFRPVFDGCWRMKGRKTEASSDAVAPGLMRRQRVANLKHEPSMRLPARSVRCPMPGRVGQRR